MTWTAPRRRSTAEVRRLILEAAGELFQAHGYEATRTQDIADRAGVSQRLLYSNFESKAGLFNAAVVQPLSDLVAGYLATWRSENPDPTTPEHRIASILAGLYHFARDNNAAMALALTGTRVGGQSPGQDLAEQVATIIHTMLDNPAVTDYPVDAPAFLIDVVAMAFGAALFRDALVPAGLEPPSHRRLVDEMASITLFGMLNRDKLVRRAR